MTDLNTMTHTLRALDAPRIKAPRVADINQLYNYIRLRLPDADYDTKQHLMSVARKHYLNDDSARRVDHAMEAVDFAIQVMGEGK